MLNNIWGFLEQATSVFLSLFFVGLVILFIYDRFVQRQHSLLVNYPVIGRFRYLFEALREPLRQYFAEETYELVNLDHQDDISALRLIGGYKF